MSVHLIRRLLNLLSGFNAFLNEPLDIHHCAYRQSHPRIHDGLKRPVSVLGEVPKGEPENAVDQFEVGNTVSALRLNVHGVRDLNLHSRIRDEFFARQAARLGHLNTPNSQDMNFHSAQAFESSLRRQRATA